MSGTCIISRGSLTISVSDFSPPPPPPPAVSLSKAVVFFNVFIQLQLPFPQRLFIHLKGRDESETINTTAKNRASSKFDESQIFKKTLAENRRREGEDNVDEKLQDIIHA